MTRTAGPRPTTHCLLCAPLHGWVPWAPWAVAVFPYARQRCQCPTHEHRLMVHHPHVPAGCLGFAQMPPDSSHRGESDAHL